MLTRAIKFNKAHSELSMKTEVGVCYLDGRIADFYRKAKQYVWILSLQCPADMPSDSSSQQKLTAPRGPCNESRHRIKEFCPQTVRWHSRGWPVQAPGGETNFLR